MLSYLILILLLFPPITWIIILEALYLFSLLFWADCMIS